jgi:hypothetical protein
MNLTDRLRQLEQRASRLAAQSDEQLPRLVVTKRDGGIEEVKWRWRDTDGRAHESVAKVYLDGLSGDEL